MPHPSTDNWSMHCSSMETRLNGLIARLREQGFNEAASHLRAARDHVQAAKRLIKEFQEQDFQLVKKG